MRARCASLPNTSNPRRASKSTGSRTRSCSTARRAPNPTRSITRPARQLRFPLTQGSKSLESKERRFVVTTGGGPGIMEAANKVASEAKGLTAGIGISIRWSRRQRLNHARPVVPFPLLLHAKFWFAYLANGDDRVPGRPSARSGRIVRDAHAVADEEDAQAMPIVLFGTEYWNEIGKLLRRWCATAPQPAET